MTGPTSPSPRSMLLPALAVTACGSMWGLYWLPLRWIEALGVGGAWAALLFNAIAVAATLPWMLSRQRWNGLAQQAVTGLMLGTAFTIYTVSLVLTDVIHAILLFYLTPVWSTLAGWIFLRERVTLSRLAAVVLGLAGLWLILGSDGGLPVPRNAGDWLALASGILWSAGTLLSYARPTTNIALSVLAFASGGLVASIPVLALAIHLDLPLAALDHLMPALPWVLLVALVIFIPPTFLVLWAAQRMDPGRIGILLMTEVLFGAMSAAAYSGESFGPREAMGTAMIVAAGLTEVLGRR